MQPEKDDCIVGSKATTMAMTILIVDDNAHIRLALCEQFKRESDFEVCGEAENGKRRLRRLWNCTRT